MVRGGVTSWVALTVALAAGTPALAQRPTEKFPLATDALFGPGPAVPQRIANQLPEPDEPDFTLQPGSIIPTPQGKPRQYRFTRRYGTPNTLDSTFDQATGVRRFVFTGGVIINAINDRGEEIELATDDAVVWIRGMSIDANNIQGGGFEAPPEGKTQVEAYLAGNVIVRTRSREGTPQVLRAREVYYDVENERAVALAASLEYQPRRLPDPVRLRGEEVRKLDAENWEVLNGSFDGSRTPSDPMLRFDTPRATLNEQRTILRNAFGIPYRYLLTGEPVEGNQQLLTAYRTTPKIAGVPVFYLPVLRTQANDPLGPLGNFVYSKNRIFGDQFYTTWQMFELLALKPPPGHIWNLNTDYLSARGFALGTDYTYILPDSEDGLSGPKGLVKIYGLKDHGTDILGGNRGPQPEQPDFRGRATWRHQQEILQGVYYQGQVAFLSDKNFFEQFYKQEFDRGPNQETFAYLTWQRRNLWASALAEYRLDRPWVDETQWLPRFDGAVTGRTFLDNLFVYSANGSLGYARARTSNSPAPVLPTDVNLNTGRIDLMQELSVPFSLGPVKMAPYGTLDLTGYTDDLKGNSTGRVWGGGGFRSTLPLSRLYEDVSSDLFNLRGLYHKVVFGANYLYAKSSVPYTQLPLLDRLNDDATDQSWRNITPMQTSYVSGPAGVLLSQGGDPNNQFNPQQYIIRRLATSRVDTLDDIHALQMDVRQRFQTKRGYPGLEHTVDVVSAAAGVTYFPEASRDNFGNPFAFLEYDALWNIGDRTAVTSQGWFEPYDGGSRYYNVTAFLNRPDRTQFSVGYRHTDPLNSRAITANISYQFSRRYFLSVGTSYDLGLSKALSNSINLTRNGTDFTFIVGFSYNSLVNNLSFQFLVAPNFATSMLRGRGGFGFTPQQGLATR